MTILNKEKILEVARAFIDEGKYDKAIREYEKILLADPGDLRVKLRIAELHTKRKQIADAIRIYHEVADAYAAEGFYLKAVTVHKNILRLNPSLSDTNEQLASLYEKMGLIGDAVRQYDILASSLDLKGQAERVLEIRHRIVQLAPKDGAARIKLAEICQREGKIEDAIDQYEEYARQLEESGGDRMKLADLFEKILAHRPDRHAMLRKLVAIYDDLGDHKKAIRCLENGKELVERDPALLALAARIYAAQNQNETARARYLLLAELQAEAGDVDAALAAYGEILVILPEEEDRLARRVEELRPGALPEIAARAARRREALEQEEIRRQQQEEEARESGKKATEDAARAKRLGRQAPPVAQAEVAPLPAPPMPQIELPTRVKPTAAPAPVAPPVALPTPPPTADRSIADASFDLGLVYRRMGLDEEAAAEFAKAREIYAACQAAGIRDHDIAQRMAQIEAAAAGEPVREQKAEVGEQKTEGREQRPEYREQRTEAREQAPDNDKKPEEKKKKISFV